MNDATLLTPYFLDDPVPGLESLARPEWQINKVDLPDTDRQGRMTAIHRPLAEWTTAAVNRGERPVSIAGDCCATLGFLAGLQQAGINPTLIWLDAHGDFNTWETTPSGFLGGMPLAMLTNRGEQRMVQGAGLTPLPDEQVILTDARDLDPGERIAVAGSGMRHLPDAARLLDFPLPEGPLYVHFDVDVVNPEDVPAVSYLAPGGPSAASLRPVFRRLAQTGRLAAVSVTTWNPTMAGADHSRTAVMPLLDDLLS